MCVRCGEMAAEVERLQGLIDAANAQEPVAKVTYNNVGISLEWMPSFVDLKSGEKLFASPMPAQQSPAVAVPDNFISLITAIKQYSNGDIISVPDNIQTEEQFFDWLRTPSPSPRITEQDAREILKSASMTLDHGDREIDFDYWLKIEGRAMLNKLNGDENGK